CCKVSRGFMTGKIRNDDGSRRRTAARTGSGALMYIDGVTAPLPAARTRPRRIPARLLLTAAALLVAGCDLFDGGKGPPVVARPTTLTPEADVFRDADLRRYTWFEELRRDGK